MADNKKKGRNPANQQSELFKALTRLFSGPILTTALSLVEKLEDNI